MSPPTNICGVNCFYYRNIITFWKSVNHHQTRRGLFIDAASYPLNKTDLPK